MSAPAILVRSASAQPRKRRPAGRVALLALLLVATTIVSAAGPTSADAATTATVRVSVTSDGTQGDLDSESSSISADGRYVAFTSQATNLVAGTTNDNYDVFVHDRQSATTTRVSVADDGTQGNGTSSRPSISADGRYVAFQSTASNLVADDTNATWDVFVHDRQSATTTRVSVASDGAEGDELSVLPSISADGRYVAFESDASNLVPGDTNDARDVFVHDRQSATTTGVSVASDGTTGNGWSAGAAISADGGSVAYSSSASNLVPNDTNGVGDVFVRNLSAGTTERVSLTEAGGQASSESYGPAISGDGSVVAFTSGASDLVAGPVEHASVFVRDRTVGTTVRVSEATDGTRPDSWSDRAAISDDATVVAFRSTATNLVAGDTNGADDVFFHHLASGVTDRVSVATDGTQGDAGSHRPSISANGSAIAFDSLATNLVPGDTNDERDVFVRVVGPDCFPGFTDVANTHPFCAEIAELVDRGITTGFDDGTFRPTNPVSRQAMAAFIFRYINIPYTPPGEPTFSDVGVDHPFRAEIEWLASMGITTGFDDGTFRPTEPVSRQAMAAFLNRLGSAQSFDPPAEPTFSDVGVGHPFRLEIEWLADSGISTGFDDGTFRPVNPVSRQAMAAFIIRLDAVPL